MAYMQAQRENDKPKMLAGQGSGSRYSAVIRHAKQHSKEIASVSMIRPPPVRKTAWYTGGDLESPSNRVSEDSHRNQPALPSGAASTEKP